MLRTFSNFSNIDQRKLALLKKINNPNVIRSIDHHTLLTNQDIADYTNDMINDWINWRNSQNNLDFNESKKQIERILKKLDKKYKLSKKIRQATLIRIMRIQFAVDKIGVITFYQLLELLTTKNRTHSGITEIAIMTGPGEFSCKFDCYYCPNQPGIARSYIKEEPAVRRAAQNDFDCVRQINTRISTYLSIGQPADKGEFIILGGTFSNYSDEYRTEFMRDLYYACNTYFDEVKRSRKSLNEEKNINQNQSLFKVIGLTVETRPDCIDEAEILRYISYGVTRVQLGVQHTNDRLLKKINRKCYTKDTIRAMTMLKQAGFKILCHYMPNLPDTTPDMDIDMFNDVIYSPNLIADEWKIYPTSVTTTSDKDIEDVFTVIEKWYNDGKYVPYSYPQLEKVIRHAKNHVPPYVRISRVFRDIPVDNIIGGADVPHMRQVVQKKMARDGEFCRCIRCREIKNRNIDIKRIVYTTHKYHAHGGIEYFISANYMPDDSEFKTLCETEQQQLRYVGGYLIGFCRLRIQHENENLNHLPVLKDAALIRELHVYGKMVPNYLSGIMDSNTQHRGIGSKLMQIAENIAIENKIYKIAVISGVGVRTFYQKKLDYKLEDNYMIKHLSKPYDLEYMLVEFVKYIILIYIFIKIFQIL